MTSTSSSSMPSTPTVRPKQEKRRAANLLRDYYGLSSESAQTPQSPAISNEDAIDHSTLPKVDLPSLLRSNNLSALLSKESELIVQIRELDGERQSLVYNHHHELVAASDTIRDMKVKSESLDPSLEALQTSFESISTLSSNLDVLRRPATKESPAAETPGPNHLDPLHDLEPIVTLPSMLSDLIEGRVDATSAKGYQDARAKKEGLARAEHLWGTMEPVLAAWTEAGVTGIREIAAECRTLLKDGRKATGSSFLATAGS